VATRPGLRRALEPATTEADALTDKFERPKAGVGAKVEFTFRVIERQFGHVKVRYRGLAKNAAQLKVLFGLNNLWMVTQAAVAEVRPAAKGW